jgi:hypothetical protein
VGLFRDMAAIPGEIAGNVTRALTRPPRWSYAERPPRDTPTPLWPHPGDTRIRGGITEIWSAGWQTPQRAESRTTSSMAANPDYARAQKARQARSTR